MVCHAALWIVIGPDSFTSVASANLTFAVACIFRVGNAFVVVIEFAFENAESFEDLYRRTGEFLREKVNPLLEQGKDIYAAPGRITDPLSAGCNRLIRQGAGILLSPEELTGELDFLSEKNKLPLEKSERLVYSCLDLLPKSMEKISEETALDIVTLAEILFALEEKGFVQEAWQNHYISVN